MTIDTLIAVNNGKNKGIAVDSYGSLVLKNPSVPDNVIFKDMTEDFDVYVGTKGRIDIFGITKSGTLIQIENSSGIWKSHTVLERKNQDSKILGVRVFKINDSFHLFYCIDYKERLLIHQVVCGEDYTISPEVIDHIGRRFLYDVCIDEDGNMHVLYATDEGHLMYRSYVYSSKSYRPPQKICERNIHLVTVACREGKVYAVLKLREHNSMKLCVCNVLNGKMRNAVTLAKNDAKLAAYFKENRFYVYWEEDSMGYEISCDEDLSFVKASPLGKCSGLYALRVPEGKQGANFCLCNLYGDPFDKNLIEYEQAEPAKYKPKGYDVEEMSKKYIDVLKAKAEEIQKNDFAESLARIEASLNRLIVAVERAFPEKKDIENIEKENEI